MSSQPPPRARPSTAATVGTDAYLRAMVAPWNLTISSSTWASVPAISLSATPTVCAILRVAERAARFQDLISLDAADGGGAFSRDGFVFDRLAPAENGGAVCQRTSAR